MPQDPTDPERKPRPRKRSRAGGHAPDAEGAPLCGATPQELRFSDPPTCSQCASVLSLQAGRVKKKKNRVKGKHAKGPEGKALCGVEAKKVHFAKSPSCVNCRAALGLDEAEEPAKAKAKAPARDCVACLKRDLKAARSSLEESAGGAQALIAELEERLAAVKGTKGAKARSLSCRRCREEKKNARERAREAKTAGWVFVSCPVCEASVPEHRLARHMRKVHQET
jgi:hypothetical protein